LLLESTPIPSLSDPRPALDQLAPFISRQTRNLAHRPGGGRRRRRPAPPGPDGGPLAPLEGTELEGPATECQSQWPSAQVRPQARTGPSTGSASLTPDESGQAWPLLPVLAIVQHPRWPTQPQASMQSAGGGPPGILVDAADLRLAPVPTECATGSAHSVPESVALARRTAAENRDFI
jgi:hypothetical protein